MSFFLVLILFAIFFQLVGIRYNQNKTNAILGRIVDLQRKIISMNEHTWRS